MLALVLPTDLDQSVIADLHPRFLEALAEPAITIDGSSVQHADVAGVQLLCALVIAADRRGIPLVWSVVSPALVTAARLLGVEHVVRIAGVRQDGLEWFD